MMPVRLTNSQLHEVLQAARTVPFDLRRTSLERLAVELRDKDPLVDGLAHCIAYEVAHTITWSASRRRRWDSRLMRDRERQQWTEYVRRMEAKKGKKPRAPRAKKPSGPSPAELEAALDDLTREAESRRSG
jgi:hypothetical protein